jgi:hypothetical protein
VSKKCSCLGLLGKRMLVFSTSFPTIQNSCLRLTLVTSNRKPVRRLNSIFYCTSLIEHNDYLIDMEIFVEMVKMSRKMATSPALKKYVCELPHC